MSLFFFFASVKWGVRMVRRYIDELYALYEKGHAVYGRNKSLRPNTVPTWQYTSFLLHVLSCINDCSALYQILCTPEAQTSLFDFLSVTRNNLDILNALLTIFSFYSFFFLFFFFFFAPSAASPV